MVGLTRQGTMNEGGIGVIQRDAKDANDDQQRHRVPEDASLQVLAEQACAQNRVDTDAEHEPDAEHQPQDLAPAWPIGVPTSKQAADDQDADADRQIEQRLRRVLQAVEHCREEDARQQHQQAFGHDLRERHHATEQAQ